MQEYYDLISKNICGNDFRHLIDLLGENADFFTMNKHYFNDGKPFLLGQLFEALAPFCTDTLRVCDWYCNFDMSQYYMDTAANYRIEVQVYPSNKTTLDILKSKCDNIYLFGKGLIPMGEDLCFFKNSELFMGTVSHEWMCGVYPLTDEMSQKLQMYGKWKQFPCSDGVDINRIKYSPRLCR